MRRKRLACISNRAMAAACALSLAVGLEARAEEPWQVVSRGPMLVKARSVPGSAVREFWAEADLRASVRDLQDTLLDADSFARFMPYTLETRRVSGIRPDGTWLVYARVNPPMVANRDYVVKTELEHSVEADGSGWFQNHWTAVDGEMPRVDGVVRMLVNEGRWTVTPLQDGRSHVVYRFRMDPGGWLPPFLADLGNQSGVTDVIKAAEREAQRRGAARAAAEVADAGTPRP